MDLWNKCLDNGSIPVQWCKGATCQVPKSGDQKDDNNYRGMMLLPVITKILFAILAARISTWAEEVGILPEEQFGFRAGRRTTDALFIMDTRIERAKGKKRELYCCFVEFQKAFDSVAHHLLWKKLHSLGMSTKRLSLLRDTHSKAVAQVLLNHGSMEVFQV